MKKFVVPLVIILIIAACVAGFYVGKNIQSTDQSASIIQAVSKKTSSNLGTVTLAGVASLGWKEGHCHHFRDGVDLGETTINFSQADCHSISTNPKSNYNFLKIGTNTTAVVSMKAVTIPIDPAGLIIYESSSGSCLAWRINRNGTRTYLGTVKLGDADCHATIQAPTTSSVK